jgi:hypothetical protein
VREIIYICICCLLGLFSCKFKKPDVKEESGSNLQIRTEIIDIFDTLDSDNDDLSKDYGTGVTDLEIYNFINYLVDTGVLDLYYGLNPEPEESFAYLTHENSILNKMLIKEKVSNIELSGDSFVFQMDFESSITTCPFVTETLSQDDTAFIKRQSKRLDSFEWDVKRLGFNEDNTNNYYRISLPYFSKDKTRVLILVRDLCPGLCGGGKELLFINKGDVWEKQVIGSWIH